MAEHVARKGSDKLITDTESSQLVNQDVIGDGINQFLANKL
jgi:hypothetical protein